MSDVVARVVLACLGATAGALVRNRREFFFYLAGYGFASLAWVLM